MNTAGEAVSTGEAVEGGLTSEGILQVHQLQQEPSVLLRESGGEFFVCLIDLGFEVLDLFGLAFKLLLQRFHIVVHGLAPYRTDGNL